MQYKNQFVPQFVVIHTKAFASSRKQVDFFWNSLVFSMIQPTNVGNLISDSSAFSKPSLYTWKLLTQVLLKPSLKDFEHNLTRMGSEHNSLVI